MLLRRVGQVFGIVLGILAAGYLLIAVLFYLNQEKLVYHPTHEPTASDLTPWMVDGQLFGYAREAAVPKAVWLIMQGNGGQAGHRGYFKRVPPDESLYILEYPGYGRREGPMTRDSVNAAATAAYHELRRRFPGISVGVVGESFGSGPGTLLARDATPPDRFVLFVPLARFDLVMSRFVPLLPIRLLLKDNWDNVASLRDYRGPVTIYAAERDAVIPREHTLMLARSVPQARLIWVPAGHNDCGENEIARLSPPPN